MAIVQSFPAGYLSLLGIKQGTNPGQSADFVQPVLSIDTFYLASAIDSAVSTTGAATNVGDSAIIAVPSGEAWRLLAIGGNVLSVTAPTVVRVALQLLEPKQLLSVPVLQFENSIVAAGDVIQNGVAFPQPIVVPPGTLLRAQLLNDLGAVTLTIEVRALFQRLTV